MSSDADVHEVGLIPITLMVLGNTMRSDVLLLSANLASIGGIAIYGWLVTVIDALRFSMVYAKMSFLDPSPGGSYAYARRCFGPFLGHQTNILYRLTCWIGNIVMAAIGVGYLSYPSPILKGPLVLTVTCVVVLWIFVLLNIVDPKVITRVQAVVTVLALIPIVGITVFGWFWFCGRTYMAAWNVSGLDTFDTIQSALNVTLQSFIGVENAFVTVSVTENPKRNISVATIGGALITAVYYVLSTTAIMGMIPNAALHVPASPLGDTARMALGDTAGAIVSFYAAAGCLGLLGSRTLLAGRTAGAATDDGLSPPIFARVDKAGTSVAGLTIVGTLVTIPQFSSISSNATEKPGPVSSVSAIFTLVPYLCTCVVLLSLGYDHFGKVCPVYLAVTTIALLYCIWAVVGFGVKEVMWLSVTLMVITAIHMLSYNRLHKNSYPLGTSVNKDQSPLIQQT